MIFLPHPPHPHPTNLHPFSSGGDFEIDISSTPDGSPFDEVTKRCRAMPSVVSVTELLPGGKYTAKRVDAAKLVYGVTEYCGTNCQASADAPSCSYLYPSSLLAVIIIEHNRTEMETIMSCHQSTD
jgi:hypothetical protein